MRVADGTATSRPRSPATAELYDPATGTFSPAGTLTFAHSGHKATRLLDGSVLVVSHDRYFLDSVVNTIWEMSATEIEPYRGNYSAYTRQRAERWARRRLRRKLRT